MHTPPPCIPPTLHAPTPHAPLPCTPPAMHTPPYHHHTHPSLWTERLAHASENITLLQTSFAGSNQIGSINWIKWNCSIIRKFLMFVQALLAGYNPVADHGLLRRRDTNPKGGDTNLLCYKIFAQKFMKEIGLRGALVSTAHPHGSATAM